MDIDKVITILASLIGVFWIVLQIMTHVHEKGSRNALRALAIVVLLAVPMILLWRTPAPTVPPAIPSRSPAVAVSVATPVQPSPTASASVDASPAPSATPKTTLLAAFQVLVNRNLIGGVSNVSLHCTFSPTGTQALTVTSYTITIHGQTARDAEPRDHVFDRVLEKPIVLAPGTPVIKDVPVDSEVGDLLLAYRKNPSTDWVRVTWKGMGPDGQPVLVDSGNNGNQE